MKIVRNIEVEGSDQRPMLTDLFFTQNGKPKPVVVFSHGFKGFKDWGHFNQMAEEFARSGFVFVKFNFSHNGTTPENPAEFADLEAFGNNNYLKELDDLEKIINWLQNYDEIQDEADFKQLYLLGHSRGGAISALKASEEPRIKKLCTWSAVADLEKRMQMCDSEEWQEKGVTYIANARTGQQMPIYYQFREIYYRNRHRLDIERAVKSLKIPYLIAHGTADEAVPVVDAIKIKNWKSGAELFLLDSEGHTFGAKHPFQKKELPKGVCKLLEKTIEFFRE